MRPLRLLSMVALVAAVLSGCSRSRSTGQGLPPATASTPGLYVAIGAGDSRGEGTDNPMRDAWTQVFFRTLPEGFAFVNLASNGATIADAVSTQLPEAETLHPTLVTVALGANDLLASLPAARFGSDLTTLLRGLRSGGATVLVASVPPVQFLPAYLACADPAQSSGGCSPLVPRPVPPVTTVTADVVAYNAEVTTVAAATGAVVVNVDAAAGTIEAAAGTSPIGSDGFDPSAAGAQAIAGLFEQAWRNRPAAGRTG